MADRNPQWQRLLSNPDWQDLWAGKALGDRVEREKNRILIAEGGVTDPHELGRIRGFLEALEWLRRLPKHQAELEQRLLASEAVITDEEGEEARRRSLCL